MGDKQEPQPSKKVGAVPRVGEEPPESEHSRSAFVAQAPLLSDVASLLSHDFNGVWRGQAVMVLRSM